jgi:Fic family protein
LINWDWHLPAWRYRSTDIEGVNPYFNTNRQRYYELLDRVRTHGDWETWLEFFLTGVKETAQQAADTSREILLTLIEKDRRKIEEFGRPAGSVLRVHLHLQRKPIITIPATAEQLSLSAPTVAKALRHMVMLGMFAKPLASSAIASRLHRSLTKFTLFKCPERL